MWILLFPIGGAPVYATAATEGSKRPKLVKKKSKVQRVYFSIKKLLQVQEFPTYVQFIALLNVFSQHHVKIN